MPTTSPQMNACPKESAIQPATSHPSLVVRLVTFAAIVVPFISFLAVPFICWNWGMSWSDLALFASMYVLTSLGITVGFHRLFTHHSFETFTWVKVSLAILGSMAIQGPLLKWVALHRLHHHHSDAIGDPHSPHTQGQGILGLLRGIWHAHLGWLLEPDPENLLRYVPDLHRSRPLRATSALFPLWAALGLVVPGVLGGLISLSWTNVLTGILWGGLLRVFLVHHVTWSVNSACHLWGMRPFQSNDRSRNNIVFGILAMGEGWHNTHHAFPTSARHGLRWWQFDVSYYMIRTLELGGLAWNAKLPTISAQRKASRSALDAGPPRLQGAPNQNKNTWVATTGDPKVGHELAQSGPPAAGIAVD